MSLFKRGKKSDVVETPFEDLNTPLPFDDSDAAPLPVAVEVAAPVAVAPETEPALAIGTAPIPGPSIALAVYDVGHAAAIAKVDALLELFDAKLRDVNSIGLSEIRAMRKAIQALTPNG